ncbi:MAG: glycoside hydrolase family 5 protein [Bacteroidales bacterium]|nr:glycoside hydrolase family 5 protein [Bacteroidales bacterium]NLK81466.1 glycoside hydrolase family 5 protein [Bacteroidales bacterium]HPY82673.1 cellulase family glycosylhydrolase [Bacteroidales bacterium]
MNYKKLLSIASCMFLFACSSPEKKVETTPDTFEITAGVNISHWLSQVYGFSDRATFFTKADVQLIDSLGFDHIRIPIDEKEMWNEDGTPISEAFSYLTHAIEWCLEYNIRVIVDLHIIRSFYFNAGNEGGENTLFSDPKEQEHFYSLWQELSDTLKRFPTHMVAYELLNEAVAENPEDWNTLVAHGVAVIREQEPTRIIFIGSNNWQIAATFPALRVPENDTNLVLSMHNYDPILFTHYKANWTEFSDFDDSVSYPGIIISEETYEKNKNKYPGFRGFEDGKNAYGPETFETIFKPALEKAQELGLPLYCGEFGALPYVKREHRLQYYRDIVSVFKKHSIAYTAWDYKGLFGIRGWDSETNTNTYLDTELAEIVVGVK